MSTINIAPRNTIESKLDFLNHTYSYDMLDEPYAMQFPLGNHIDPDAPYSFIDYEYRKAVDAVKNNKAMYIDSGEAVVTGYAPLRLHTYYPTLSGKFPVGHSKITYAPNASLQVNTKPNYIGYNFVTNNCSDDTGKCLEAVFQKDMNTFGFTTPGDVLDFAKQNGAYYRGTNVYIPMNKERWKRFKNYVNDYKERILNK